MKKQLFSTLTLTLALVAGLTACSSDDNFVGNNKDLVSNQKTVITVTDIHGFKATDGTPQTGNMTRALPAQYANNEEIERGTIFEENDCIGVYVVDETTHTIEQANVPYHYFGQMWDSNSDIAFATSGKSYYAYFPYQETPTGAPTVGTTFSGSDAADVFFSSLISSWTILADQSTQANYVASDLMVGKATVTDNSGTTEVEFQMDHQMGLVVLNLGQIKHVLRSGDYYWFDEVNKKCKTTDGCYKPWYIHDEWRAIVPVNTTSKFSATDDEWTINAKVTEKGEYQVYNIGHSAANPNSGVKYFDLQLGDIYYNDGSLMHVTADNVDERYARATEAEGFVVFISDGSAEDQKVVDPSLGTNGMLARTYSHALVMRLEAKNTSTSNANTWVANNNIGHVTYEYNTAGNRVKSFGSVAQAVNDYDGLVSSTQLKNTNATFDSWFNPAHDGPSGLNVPNSGWFVPGMGQLVHSLLQTGAISQQTYNDMLQCKDLHGCFKVNPKIWKDYMYDAVAAYTLPTKTPFTQSTLQYGLMTSSYYPNSAQNNVGNIKINWTFACNDGNANANTTEVDAWMYCYFLNDNTIPAIHYGGYTCMMLAF